MARRRTLRIALTTAAALLSAGCPGDRDASEATGFPCGAEGRTGETECGGVICDDNEWCDSFAGFECRSGCLTDTNCGEDSFCQRGGEAVGLCRNCEQLGTGDFGDGGMGCQIDVHCDTDIGANEHEICDEGRCRLGCRRDEHCGPDFFCDLSLDVCVEEI